MFHGLFLPKYYIFAFHLGYYCPEGQAVSTPSPYLCVPGFYCPEGSPIQLLCPAGTYQNLQGQSGCKECVAGYYCDNSIEPVVNHTSYVCPMGEPTILH